MHKFPAWMQGRVAWVAAAALVVLILFVTTRRHGPSPESQRPADTPRPAAPVRLLRSRAGALEWRPGERPVTVAASPVSASKPVAGAEAMLRQMEDSANVVDQPFPPGYGALSVEANRLVPSASATCPGSLAPPRVVVVATKKSEEFFGASCVTAVAASGLAGSDHFATYNAMLSVLRGRPCQAIDCGANEGAITTWLAHRGCRVTSYEALR